MLTTANWRGINYGISAYSQKKTNNQNVLQYSYAAGGLTDEK